MTLHTRLAMSKERRGKMSRHVHSCSRSLISNEIFRDRRFLSCCVTLYIMQITRCKIILSSIKSLVSDQLSNRHPLRFVVSCKTSNVFPLYFSRLSTRFYTVFHRCFILASTVLCHVAVASPLSSFLYVSRPWLFWRFSLDPAEARDQSISNISLTKTR